MALKVTPAGHGSLIDRLTNLPGAGRHDRCFRAMEFETGWIPWQAKETDKPSALAFQVRHQVLVLHVEHRQRQNPPPVSHEVFGCQVFVATMGKIVRVRIAAGKPLKIAGKTGIAHLAMTENHAGRGVKQANQADPIDVGRHLVDYALSRAVE